MRLLIYFILFVAVVSVICIATKPEKEIHVQKLSSVVAEAIASEAEEYGIPTDEINTPAGNEYISSTIGKMLTVEDYGLFTLGKVRFGNKEYTVSVGVFGTVLTFSSEMLADKLDAIIEKQF